MHFRLIDAAPKHVLAGDDVVPSIEEDAPEDFVGQVGAVGSQIFGGVHGFGDFSDPQEAALKDALGGFEDLLLAIGVRGPEVVVAHLLSPSA